MAGLVRGAHRGDGLGNRFLGTLRECQVLCHVIRVFDDSNVGHVDGMVDPVSDANVVQLELILADLEHAARRLDKKSCTGVERKTLEVVVEGLERGRLAGDLGLSPDALASIKSMGLLTLKPVIYAFNVDEVDFVYRSQACQSIQNIMNSIQYCDPLTDLWTLVSAKVEAEVAALPDDQQSTYLMDLGMEDVHQSHGHQTMLCYHSLPTMVQRRLCLSTVYTGPGVPAERSQTTKAHLLVPNDDGATTTTTTTYDLAGRLHRDIQKGFIRAEVSSAGALLEQPNYQAAKEAGLTHVEGREYVLQPNDVVLIKWN